jgi:hypothetical protein
MGSYLNLGSTAFQGSLRSQIYIDKSGLIEKTNTVLGTEQKYVCVSRPRRFGKSMAANMLAAYLTIMTSLMTWIIRRNFLINLKSVSQKSI